MLTATNKPLPYVTDRQLLSAADVRLVQVVPSGLVITRFPDPVALTATNKPLPYVTEYQALSDADERLVQSIPFVLVITWLFGAAMGLTATNKPLPKVIPYQSLSEADVRLVQVIPSAVAWEIAVTLNTAARIAVLKNTLAFFKRKGKINIDEIFRSGRSVENLNFKADSLPLTNTFSGCHARVSR